MREYCLLATKLHHLLACDEKLPAEKALFISNLLPSVVSLRVRHGQIQKIHGAETGIGYYHQRQSF